MSKTNPKICSLNISTEMPEYDNPNNQILEYIKMLENHLEEQQAEIDLMKLILNKLKNTF